MPFQRTGFAARMVAMAVAVTLAQPARAADEAELKAAIVFNLMLFVDWPAVSKPAPGAPWVLCISPSNPNAEAMRRLSGRPLRDAHLELQPWPPAPGARPCHATFLGPDDLGPSTPPFAARPGLLTISDAADPDSSSVSIAIQHNGPKLGFGLNLPALRRAQLQPSAKLLRLAQGVQE